MSKIPEPVSLESAIAIEPRKGKKRSSMKNLGNAGIYSRSATFDQRSYAWRLTQFDDASPWPDLG
jgi:hypothetical protein